MDFLGSKVNTEAWQVWTPTFANFTLGNGSADCKYKQIGKTVFIRVVITLGSTSAMGSSPTISLPVTSITPTDTLLEICCGWILNAGTARYPLSATWATTTTLLLSAISSTNTYQSVTATVPHTWGNGDKLYFQGFYEAS